MSLDTTCKHIRCDSDDCNAILPVPLRISRPAGDPRSAAPDAGWAFISGVYEDRHLCPDCAGKLLTRQAA